MDRLTEAEYIRKDKIEKTRLFKEKKVLQRKDKFLYEWLTKLEKENELLQNKIECSNYMNMTNTCQIEMLRSVLCANNLIRN